MYQQGKYRGKYSNFSTRRSETARLKIALGGFNAVFSQDPHLPGLPLLPGRLGCALARAAALGEAVSGRRAGGPGPRSAGSTLRRQGDTSGDRGDVHPLALLGARLFRHPNFPASPLPCKHSHAQAPAETPRTYLKLCSCVWPSLDDSGPGTAKSPQPCALLRLLPARRALSTPGRWPARRRGRACSRGAVPGWATCKEHWLRGLCCVPPCPFPKPALFDVGEEDAARPRHPRAAC